MTVSHQTLGGATWSERDFKHVLTRWNVDGLTAGQIAREIGRTRNAVCGLINRHRDQFDERTQVVRNVKQVVTVRKAIGSPPGRPGASAAEVDAAARMWMSGLPVRDMAERVVWRVPVPHSITAFPRTRTGR